MFSKLKTLKKITNQVISIDELVQIVKSNPQKELISNIRNVEYKSTEYNNLKLGVNCITPHGTFNSLSNDGLVNLSGYLYYDIDGFDTENQLNDTKNKLIDTGMVSFICKSVGGRGLSFLIKYDTKLVPNDTFIDFYKNVRSMLIDLGFKIDYGASGLVRKMIISSDDNVYYNNKVSFSSILYPSILSRHNDTNKDLRKLKVPQKRKEESIELNDTFFELIPIKELLQQIKVETKYTKDIEGDFIVEDMEYYYISLPERIMDGTKHKLYTRIVNALYYINNNITKQQVLSYLFYVNNRALPSMDSKYLYNFISRLCDNIENIGEIKIKPRIKRIHFNKNINLTKKQKQIMAAKINGTLRTNRTREIIQKAKHELGIRNMKITQKEVAEHTGLSIATVKRNWTSEKKEIKIDTPQIINESDIKLPEINENEFFNEKETQIIRYKGFKDVEIEKITPEDKKLFISKINELKENGLNPSESILLDMNIFSKEKTWFLYNKWQQKYGYTLQ